MQPVFDVLSFGTIGLDYIIRVPYWPTPERGVHAPAEEEHIGGKATNTALFLAGWGLKVAVSGQAIGDDPTGDRLLALLAQRTNLDTRFVRRVPGLRSMYCRILVNPHGERTIIGVGVDENPQTPPTPDMVRSARLLTLDLYGGPERVEAARLAAEAGLPVVVGDVRQHDHPALPHTTVAIASAAEVRRDYPGWTLAGFAAAAQAAGAQDVIITDGAADVRVFPAMGSAVSISPPPVVVVDTTGAGDAFRAGVVYGVLAGGPLAEAAALGTAAGSLNVGRPGAASSVPMLDEVQALAASLTRRALLTPE